MQTVSAAAVQDAWHELYDTTEEHAATLLDQFVREQPALAQLLADAEEEIGAVDDRGFLLLYGVWAWLAFRRAGRSEHAVSADVVAAVLARNLQQTQWLEGSGNRALLDAAQDFTRDYRQWPLLSALINDILQGEMEREQSVDDITGLLLLHAKTAVDALDA